MNCVEKKLRGLGSRVWGSCEELGTLEVQSRQLR